MYSIAPDEKNQLEIHRYLLLFLPVFHNDEFFVVGISKDYEGALELVEEITQEVYNNKTKERGYPFLYIRQRAGRIECYIYCCWS